MRIALFSPLPPKRTGIARYSLFLSAALGELAEVTLFDTEVTAETVSPNLPVIDFARDPGCIANLDDYDGCIYHLGNNPFYHLEIYKILLRKPGIVVLHDTVLYFLIAGLKMGGMVKEFCINYGADRLNELWELFQGCPDGEVFRYPYPERYPFLKRVFDQATAIIVHSQTAKEHIQKAGYMGPVHVIDLLSYESDIRLATGEGAQLKSQLGIAEGDLVIGTFGFIGTTKRLSSLIEAIERIGDSFPFKLLVVGEGEDRELKEQILQRGLDHKVLRTGFVADDDFGRYLAVTDIVVNLRYPSMGETSATLIQAIGQAKPCIVTNAGWFSELPDGCVRKVVNDEGEVADLVQSLLELAADPAAREQLGKRALGYLESHCSPKVVARDYLDVVRSVASIRKSNVGLGMSLEQGTRSPDIKVEWTKEYLASRLFELLPPEKDAPDRPFGSHNSNSK
jgi:glycosyltransferase involved in cell wall biosynthesis